MSWLGSKLLAGSHAIVLSGLFVACSASRESKNVTAAFAEHTPRSIRVFPVFNLTTSEDAPAVVQRVAEDVLSARGYEVVRDADATLHITVKRWSEQLDVPHGNSNRCVELEGRLLDSSSGALLWNAAQADSDEPDEDGTDSSLLGSLVEYAFETAGEALLGDDGFLGDAVRDLLASLPRVRDEPK